MTTFADALKAAKGNLYYYDATTGTHKLKGDKSWLK